MRRSSYRSHNLGYADSSSFGKKGGVKVFDVASQKKALEELAGIIEPDTVNPLVRDAAVLITSDCDSRDDECEIRAVFEAVKHGTDKVPGLENGFKYVSDPRWADFFTTPSRILKQLANGINAGDCDDHASLLTGLLGSLGFLIGLRVWGRTKSEFTHVYAVVGVPKVGPQDLICLDTTVDESEVGWEPPGGHTLTALMDAS